MPLTLKQSSRLARSARLAGAMLSVAALIGVLLVCWQSRAQALQAATERSRLLTRVLEDQATRSVDAAALALTSVGAALRNQPSLDQAHVGPSLAQAVALQTSLRSAALVDDGGHVLASSSANDLGHRIPLSAWMASGSKAGRSFLMPWQSGRGLAEAVTPGASPARGFLPIALQVEHDGRPLYLLALINPDALANYQQSAIDDQREASALFSYDGQLLAATTGLPLEPGSWWRDHRLFRQALRAQDHGEWRGDGFLPGAQMIAYRVSRTRPLVVVMQQSQEAALAPWREGLWWDVGTWLVLQGLIVGATAVTLRALKVRARARLALDESHRRVATSEREMAVVLRSVQELIFRTDGEGRLSFVNARWAMVTGGSADALVGRAVPDLAAEPDRTRVAALFAHDSHTGVRTAEVSLVTAQQEARRFALTVVPLLVGERVTGFAGSAVDVSERYAAESRLQHQLDLVEMLLELSPQPTSMVDRDGCYVTVNRAWEQFTGLTRAQVIGHRVRSSLPEADEEPQSSDWVPFETVRGRSLLRYETQLRDRDGDMRDVAVSKVVVPGDRRHASGVLFTLTDVTEFRRAERATREAKEAAEETSRVKSEFIANMSHELRTPLQSILGYSELGKTRGVDASPKLAEMFARIHTSGEQMLALVNDLLDVSKLDSAVGSFDLERCDLRPQIADVVQELKPLLAARGLRVDLSQSTTALIARVDPKRFQQVIRNVLANAVRFSPEAGVIEVRSQVTSAQQIHVCVADRGPGIPPKELEHIFDAFMQSSVTKDGSGGTGLGLTICRKILAVLDGRIHAENRPDGGASFHILLPLRATAPQSVDLPL